MVRSENEWMNEPEQCNQMNGIEGIPNCDCERGSRFACLVKISDSDSQMDGNDGRNLISALNWNDDSWVESRARRCDEFISKVCDGMNNIDSQRQCAFRSQIFITIVLQHSKRKKYLLFLLESFAHCKDSCNYLEFRFISCERPKNDWKRNLTQSEDKWIGTQWLSKMVLELFAVCSLQHCQYICVAHEMAHPI